MAQRINKTEITFKMTFILLADERLKASTANQNLECVKERNHSKQYMS